MPTLLKRHGAKYIAILLGCAIYSAGVNLFIFPLHLYSSGVVGLSQLISDFICLFLPSYTQTDFNGMVYLLINIPLLLFAWRSFGKSFLIKTLLGTFGISFFLSAIPCPVEPLMPDYTAAVLLGGCICGFGIGMIMTAGGSGGGLDIVGIWMTRHFPHFSVGKMSRLYNFFLLLVYAVRFDISVVLYTFMMIVIQSLVMDRTHYQNIAVQVTVVTKVKGLDRSIMEKTDRGLTEWKGVGAYTQDETSILISVISKYEMDAFMEIVHELDPNAFVMVNERIRVEGNFQKRI